MKRIFYILLLLLALLLTACGQETTNDPNPTTAPTTVTIAPTAPTAATNATLSITPFNTPADVELMPGVTYGNQAFETFLNDSVWYNRALSCTFYDPADLPMAYFAFNGLEEQDNNTFTNEERAFLHSSWCEKYGATPWVDAVKLPVIKLNEALVVLNTNINSIQLPEDWVYYDKTDAYYAPKKPDSIPGPVDVKVTKVLRSGDNVSIFWETDKAYFNTATGEVLKDGAKMVTTLTRHSFNNDQNYFYVIVSNAPGSYTPLRFEDMNTPEDFVAFIKQEWWSRRAMGCTFENPKDISLQHYFYMGFEQDESKVYVPLTDEEKATIDAAYRNKFGKDPYTGESRLPVEEIINALSVLGVTLDEVTIPNDWIYDAKTDSWYFWRSDAYGLTGWAISNVEKSADGTVRLYWQSYDNWNTQTNEPYPNGTKMVMTMQEKSDGSYLILSNVPLT